MGRCLCAVELARFWCANDCGWNLAGRTPTVIETRSHRKTPYGRYLSGPIYEDKQRQTTLDQSLPELTTPYQTRSYQTRPISNRHNRT
jgi:hypothetical protein